MAKRKWMLKLFLVLVGLFLIFNVSAAEEDVFDYGGYEYPDTHDLAYKNPDWMGEIPGDRRLSELSLPGTHESMSFLEDGSWRVASHSRCRDGYGSRRGLESGAGQGRSARPHAGHPA